MRHFLRTMFAISALACMAACAPITAALGGLPPTPIVAADRTVLDERAALSIELAYRAATIAIGSATDAGLLRGSRAARVAELDRRVYRAVIATRAAYDAGNAASYGEAAARARSEIAALVRLLQ